METKSSAITSLVQGVVASPVGVDHQLRGLWIGVGLGGIGVVRPESSGNAIPKALSTIRNWMAGPIESSMMWRCQAPSSEPGFSSQTKAPSQPSFASMKYSALTTS